jgi:hypothetical protein
MTTSPDDLTAVDRVERAEGRKGIIALGVIVVLAVIALSFVLQILHVNRPVTYANDEEYFKYGSIGSDVVGVPYWVSGSCRRFAPPTCLGASPVSV